MTIRHLKIFVQVYTCCSVTRAAEKLNMTQPAVTRSIHELEHYYSVQLFDRLNRRLTPTEAGRRLYAQAVHLVDGFDALELSLRNSDGTGLLRVGGSITIGTVLLPGLAVRFAAQYPNLRLRVVVNSGGILQQAVAENKLDLALIESTVEDPLLESVPFRQDRMVLVLPPHHPLAAAEAITLADVAACPLLMREEGSVGRSYLDSLFAAHGLPMHPLWESTSTQALLQAVAAGLGVSILPEALVRRTAEEKTVVYRTLSDEPLQRDCFIVLHKDKFRTPAMNAFMQLCLDGRGEMLR